MDQVPGALSDALLDRLHTGKLDLPLLPTVATQVLSLARAPDVDGAKLADVLQRDQSLASQVLRLANSAAQGARVQIVSLQQAISRLGMTALRDMVVTVAVRGKVFKVEGYGDLVRPMWAHALATGYWAREIARARRSNVESAFLCGLLHDIGHPVVLQAILDIQRDTGVTYPRQVLVNAIEHYHCVVGGVLVTDWKLPEVVANTIVHHHDYKAQEHPTESAMITHLADLMATWMGAGHGEPCAIETIAGSAVLDDLNIYPDEFQQLVALRDKTAQLVAEVEA